MLRPYDFAVSSTTSAATPRPKIWLRQPCILLLRSVRRFSLRIPPPAHRAAPARACSACLDMPVLHAFMRCFLCTSSLHVPHAHVRPMRSVTCAWASPRVHAALGFYNMHVLYVFMFSLLPVPICMLRICILALRVLATSATTCWCSNERARILPRHACHVAGPPIPARSPDVVGCTTTPWAYHSLWVKSWNPCSRLLDQNLPVPGHLP